jgi:DNA-binding response OmpR family regulator
MVDDEIDTALTLGRILETSGFKVDILADPKAALGSFKTAYYDLAAIDVIIHAMN